MELKNVSINIDNGPVYIHKMAIISDYVRIEGPCYIGKSAEIRHSAYLETGYVMGQLLDTPLRLKIQYFYPMPRPLILIMLEIQF